MKDGEFFGLLCDGARSRLPRVKPSYPLASLVHLDAIVFLLKEDWHTFWLVEVDMKNKVVRSSARRTLHS
nr:unnamed protein product [Digitaria exilis]CAB3492314.1 unnamed protein product [Digitaria exilis]CAB3502774.1 unnamed protein product [Digitaria exilis]